MGEKSREGLSITYRSVRASEAGDNERASKLAREATKKDEEGGEEVRFGREEQQQPLLKKRRNI